MELLHDTDPTQSVIDDHQSDNEVRTICCASAAVTSGQHLGDEREHAIVLTTSRGQFGRQVTGKILLDKRPVDR